MSTTPKPIRDDREALRRAQAAGWTVVGVPDVGRRLVHPHAWPPHLAAEVSTIRAYLAHRLLAITDLLNTTTPLETPTMPPITTAVECVLRMRAAGYSFRLTTSGSVEIAHPLVAPPTAEADVIFGYLGRDWDGVMLEARKQITTTEAAR